LVKVLCVFTTIPEKFRAFSACTLMRTATNTGSLHAPAIVYEHSMAQYRAMRNLFVIYAPSRLPVADAARTMFEQAQQ
jgi:hypothetical protein